jgi:hypothetical protein
MGGINMGSLTPKVTGTLIAVTAGDETGSTETRFEYDWSAAVGVEAKVATQFLVQIGTPAAGSPDGVHLIVGSVNPPVVVGDTEESRQAQLARYQGKLPVTVHGRYYFSRARLEELRNALKLIAETYDEVTEAGGRDESRG